MARPARPVGEPSADRHLREQLSWVAVPMGKCSEPTNVRAGGQACPIRYQCAGCPHFESDPSYLPELRAYADDLRKEREASLAMGALTGRSPTSSASSRVIVEHVRAHEQLLEGLPAEERAVIDEASLTLRKARQSVPVAFGRRAPRDRVTDNSAALRKARRRDGGAKRKRAADAIAAVEANGEPVNFPAVARRAGVSVSLLYADRELASRVAAARDRQRQAGPERAWRLPPRSLVTEQSLRTDLANAKEQLQRLNGEVAILRERLAHQLGADADIARGRSAGPSARPARATRRRTGSRQPSALPTALKFASR